MNDLQRLAWLTLNVMEHLKDHPSKSLHEEFLKDIIGKDLAKKRKDNPPGVNSEMAKLDDDALQLLIRYAHQSESDCDGNCLNCPKLGELMEPAKENLDTKDISFPLSPLFPLFDESGNISQILHLNGLSWPSQKVWPSQSNPHEN